MAQEDKLGISNLFDSFYTHFVLRDFVGKVIPGAIVVVAFGYTVPSFRAFVDCGLCADDPWLIWWLGEIPLVVWLFLIGAFWLTGVAIQRLGEHPRAYCHLVNRARRLQRQKSKIPRRACRACCRWCWRPYTKSMLRKRAKEQRDFLKAATPRQLQHAERSDVIRESSQNTAIAVGIAVVLFAGTIAITRCCRT